MPALLLELFLVHGVDSVEMFGEEVRDETEKLRRGRGSSSSGFRGARGTDFLDFNHSALRGFRDLCVRGIVGKEPSWRAVAGSRHVLGAVNCR